MDPQALTALPHRADAVTRYVGAAPRVKRRVDAGEGSVLGNQGPIESMAGMAGVKMEELVQAHAASCQAWVPISRMLPTTRFAAFRGGTVFSAQGGPRDAPRWKALLVLAVLLICIPSVGLNGDMPLRGGEDRGGIAAAGSVHMVKPVLTQPVHAAEAATAKTATHRQRQKGKALLSYEVFKELGGGSKGRRGSTSS